MTQPNMPSFDPAAILREKLQEQTWFQRYANTVTAALGLIVGAAWFILQLGLDLPEQVTNVVLGLIALGTVVGVRLTPNGVTEKQVQEIEEYVGRHRRMP